VAMEFAAVTHPPRTNRRLLTSSGLEDGAGGYEAGLDVTPQRDQELAR
jgi:hypothetical protein